MKVLTNHHNKDLTNLYIRQNIPGITNKENQILNGTEPKNVSQEFTKKATLWNCTID